MTILNDIFGWMDSLDDIWRVMKQADSLIALQKMLGNIVTSEAFSDTSDCAVASNVKRNKRFDTCATGT